MTSPPNSDAIGHSVTAFQTAVVFANSQAGRGKSLTLLPSLRKVFAERRISAEIRQTGDLSDLEEQTQKAIGKGSKLLFAVGGDGTLQGLVNAAYGQDVTLGVVPAGGGNDFARSLGLLQDPIESLENVLEGQPCNVDLARVRFSSGKQRLFLGGGGVGLDAESARFSGIRFRDWPGRSRYVASAICAYTMYKPRSVRLLFDDGAAEMPWRQFVLACVLNTPTFGAGIRLAPEARIDDGFLDFAFLGDLSFGQLLQILPQLILRGTLRLPHLERRKFRKLRLETDPPVYFHGDGELLGLTPVEIEVVPAAVKFLAPKSPKG